MNRVESQFQIISATWIFRLIWKVALGLVCLATTLVISACHNKPITAADQPVPVRVRMPSQVQQPVSIAVSGSVEASATAMTAFEVNGRVQKVYVEEGQHVAKGQLLAELDPTDYRHGYEAALGAAEAARATENKARNGLRPEELAQARVTFERAQDELQRMKFLYDRKSLSANDYQKFEAAYQTARQNYEMARQGTRTEDKAAAAAQARASSAQMQDARTRMTRCRLVAPTAGFIGMKRIHVGDYVAAGTPVFSVLDLEIAMVRVAVPESDVSRISVGSKAQVKVPALAGHTLEGTVEALGMAADPASRSYTAKIAVKNNEHLLRDGMVAEARIFGAEQVHLLTVPGNAVVRDEHGVATVFVYDDTRHTVQARRVEATAFLGNEVIIQRGLEARDQVVVAGQQELREGAPVVLAGGAQ